MVSALLSEENFLRSPISVERFSAKNVQYAASPDYYNDLANLNGVSSYQSGVNLTILNTRGFGNIANFHFLQLIDGMDSSSPTLNFPTGSIVAINELDVANVELVPGASSALYGPNAFNGLLATTSKSPFEKQGFSAQIKGGTTHDNIRQRWYPLQQFDARFAHVWNNKIGIKFNSSVLFAREWIANDYTVDRVQPYASNSPYQCTRL